MAKCDICSKGVTYGNNVSHSNRKTSRTYKANVQTVTVKNGANTKKIKVCTSCIKSGKVERA